MAIPKKDRKPGRKTARESSGESPPSAGGKRRWPLITVFAAACLAVLIASQGLYRRSAERAALQRLPALADAKDKTSSLRSALADADAKARQAPRSSEAIGALAMLYQANHFYEQADPCYVLAMDLAPDVPQWAYFLSMVREVTGTSDMTESLLRKVLTLAPEYLPARVKLGDLLLKKGDEAGAEQEYRACLRLSPREVYALLGLGRVAVERKQWAEAEEHLQLAITVDPSFGAAYRLLGVIAEEKGDAERAEMLRAQARMRGRFRAMADAWAERLDDLCYDPLYLIVRSETAGQTGDPQKQLAMLHRAVEVAPADARPRLTLAQVLRERNDYQGALAQARKAVDLDPNDEDALNELGVLLGRHKQLAEAVKCFESALRINPESTSAFHGLGMTYSSQGNHDTAAGYFLRACELSENRFDEAIEGYVGCLVRLKRHQEGIVLLRKIVESRPSAPAVWTCLARVYLNLGDMPAAATILREALAAAPYSPQLAETLAWILVNKPESTAEETQEAVQWARRAVDMANPIDMANNMSTLAAAYARAGDFTQAIATQEQAIVQAGRVGQQERIAEFSRRLELFKAGRPIDIVREGL